MKESDRGISQKASRESKASGSRAAVRYWDRRDAREREEKIYAGRTLSWLYGSGAAPRLALGVLSRRWISRLVGAYQSSPLSRRRIASFITEFEIPIAEFEDAPYRSFNDFFVRRFRPGARSFAGDPGDLPAFAEGRYSARAALGDADLLTIKGAEMDAARLLGPEGDPRPFLGGPALVARLCPVDYHRFHYPDGGTTVRTWSVPGALHSVHPFALAARPDIFATNQRRVSILSTDHFGLLAYIEVGALNVGRIVQTHPEAVRFARGDEKGYFLFGGSTVILLGEPGKWRPESDILERTRQGQEVFVRLGDRVGKKV